jgi:diketogulonate reductase-like aldo/keto reductase
MPELPHLLENNVLKSIARKYSKTTAQICIRWLIQKNIIVIPRVN